MKSRRTFIQQLVAAGIIITIPSALNSCSSPEDKLATIKQHSISYKQLAIAQYIFAQLFNIDKNLNTNTLNTLSHFITILEDKNYNKEDKDYLKQGLIWTEETAQELFKKDFSTLASTEKKQLFDTILKEKWGKSWLSYMLDCTFESLLLDPIYNVNSKQIGWKWLNHQAGTPRPNSANTYKKLLAKKEHTEIISNINQL